MSVAYDEDGTVLNDHDQRLVAALTMLRDQLGVIVDEVLAGDFDQPERQAMAHVMATIAANLDPSILLPGQLGIDRPAS